MKTVCLLSTGHYPDDERIFEKFSLTLKDNGFRVIIILTTVNHKKEVEGIIFDCLECNNLPALKKYQIIKNLLHSYKPDIIICSQPFGVLSAKSALPRTSVIYDVTEWYPENVLLQKSSLLSLILSPVYRLIDTFAAKKADGFIFGEQLKKKRYARFKKPWEQISYYPVLRYFDFVPLDGSHSPLRILFAGHLTRERGLFALLDLLKYNESRPQPIPIHLTLAGKFRNSNDERQLKESVANLKNTKVEFRKWLPYRELASLYHSSDLFMDLREKNFMFDHSLPIKIFEAMACGRVMVYTDLKVFDEVFPLERFGYTVPHNNPAALHQLLSKLHADKTLLADAGKHGRKLVEEKYNWESESRKLISFLADA